MHGCDWIGLEPLEPRAMFSAAAAVDGAPTLAALGGPASVVRGKSINLAARSPKDAGGAVVAAEFWRDANANGLLETDTDELLGTDTDKAGGWKLAPSSSGLTAGTHWFFVRVRDNDGNWSDPAVKAIDVKNVAPKILGKLAMPSAVRAGEDFTFTLDVVDQDASATNVQVFRDTNGNGKIDATDPLIAGVNNTSGAAAFTIDARDFAGVSGRLGLLARAVDSDGAFSKTMKLGFNVSPPPGIDLSIVSVNYTGQTFRIGVAGQRANISGVGRNSGTIHSGTFWVDLYISPDRVFGDGDDVAIRTMQSMGIGPGRTAPARVSINLDILSEIPDPGSYYVIVVIDSEDDADETDESNNVWISPTANIRVID